MGAAADFYGRCAAPADFLWSPRRRSARRLRRFFYGWRAAAYNLSARSQCHVGVLNYFVTFLCALNDLAIQCSLRAK